MARRAGATQDPVSQDPPTSLDGSLHSGPDHPYCSQALRPRTLVPRDQAQTSSPRSSRKRARLRLRSRAFARIHIPVLPNGAHKTKDLPDPLSTCYQKITGTLLLLVLLSQTYGGFDDPAKARQILARRMGKPCNCAWGTLSQYPEGRVRHIQSVNSGDKMAYNFIGEGYEASLEGYTYIGKANSWQCVPTSLVHWAPTFPHWHAQIRQVKRSAGT